MAKTVQDMRAELDAAKAAQAAAAAATATAAKPETEVEALRRRLAEAEASRDAERAAREAAEKAAAAKGAGRPAVLTLKSTAKGGLSLYGLGQYPVTLYPEQWATLLGMADTIRKYIEDNAAALSAANSAYKAALATGDEAAIAAFQPKAKR